MSGRITPDGWVLQATSGTIEGITTMIRRFWYDTRGAYTVDPETLIILRDGKPFSENFRIRHGRGRQLRFEGRLAREVYP